MPPPHHDHHHHDHHEEMVKYDDYEFDALPPHLKDAAKALGYDKKLWDEDGLADTEEMDWHDLTHEQRKAAEQFGYHPKLWDEGHGHRHPPPPHHDHDHHHDHHHHHHEEHNKPDDAPKNEDEKKSNEEDAPDVSNLDISDADAEEAYEDKEETDDGKKEESNQKKQFKLSKSYGGGGGEKFDHGNNRHISKITIHADGHVVHGLEIGYTNTTKKAGGCGGKAHTFTLERGEVITSVTVRSNKYVQSLGFKTNKGNELGPVGGKGWSKIDLRGNDTEGEEVKVHAPIKYQLCGLTGRNGKYIDEIAFRWGPVPQQGKKQSK